MQLTTLLAAALTSLALTTAAPIDDAIIARYPLHPRQLIPTGTAGIAAPTGTGVAYPTGTSTSSSSCPVDGAIVCNGPTQYGQCNFGRVVFRPVAAGTKCVDGEIV